MSDIGKKDDEQLANEIGQRALAQIAREELAQVEDIRARRNSHKWLRDEKQSPDGNGGRWSCEDDIQILLNCIDRALELLGDQLHGDSIAKRDKIRAFLNR